MLRWLLRRTIESFERTWTYDASYLKEIADLSSWAAFKFALATSLGSDRSGVPLAALCAAGITAVRSEDCGPCTQLGVAMPRAVVTLAFAITTARMYPTVKYAMGHGKVCSQVVVDGAPLAIDRGLTDRLRQLTSA